MAAREERKGIRVSAFDDVFDGPNRAAESRRKQTPQQSEYVRHTIHDPMAAEARDLVLGPNDLPPGKL